MRHLADPNRTRRRVMREARARLRFDPACRNWSDALKRSWRDVRSSRPYNDAIDGVGFEV